MSKAMIETTEQWIDAGDYQFLLDGEEIRARNHKGVLSKIPAKVRTLPEYERLDALRTALKQHRQSCARSVTKWFLQGDTIPIRLVSAVWPDEAWQAVLRDSIVNCEGRIGLLRSADQGSLGLVDLDGETIFEPVSDDRVVSLPHPILIDDLPEWREFAVELNVSQGFNQLFRDAYAKPVSASAQRDALHAYQGAKYEKAKALIGRSRGGGFTVDFNYGISGVSVNVIEEGAGMRATLDVRDEYDESATLGSLSFSREGQNIPAESVGAVTWSEGIRMAEFVFSGRTVAANANDEGQK